MSIVRERIQEIKAVRMVLEGKGGKFHQNLNLLFTIILGILIPELAVLVALAWLFGWLHVEFQQMPQETPA
jgi:hypothetical protein